MSSVTHAAISPDSGTLWTEPGAWEVSEGVWRVPLPLPMDALQAVNVYVIEKPDGLTLIDGGWAIETSRETLAAALRAIGHGVTDIRSFLVTHVHRDHYTQAVALRNETGAHISLGLGDKPSLDRLLTYPDFDSDPRLALLRIAGAHDLAQTWADATRSKPRDLTSYDYPDTWLSRDQELFAGERKLRAMATPGHTRGHFVFSDAQAGLLFAGDHVLPTITPSIGFETAPAAQPLSDFLRSLAKVRALPDARLLPAHGPVAPSVHARVEELLIHHEARLEQCVSVLGAGEHSAYQVAQRLKWTGRGRDFRELDTFNAVLATLEARAHLEVLVAQGRLVHRPTDEALCYSRPTEPASEGNQ